MKTIKISDLTFILDEKGTLWAIEYKGEFQAKNIEVHFENELEQLELTTKDLISGDHQKDANIHFAVAETEAYMMFLEEDSIDFNDNKDD